MGRRPHSIWTVRGASVWDGPAQPASVRAEATAARRKTVDGDIGFLQWGFSPAARAIVVMAMTQHRIAEAASCSIRVSPARAVWCGAWPGHSGGRPATGVWGNAP